MASPCRIQDVERNSEVVFHIITKTDNVCKRKISLSIVSLKPIIAWKLLAGFEKE